jgi:hypothetical protein
VDYQVVATFVTQFEDSGTLTEPLQMIKEWSPPRRGRPNFGFGFGPETDQNTVSVHIRFRPEPDYCFRYMFRFRPKVWYVFGSLPKVLLSFNRCTICAKICSRSQFAIWFVAFTVHSRTRRPPDVFFRDCFKAEVTRHQPVGSLAA